MFAIWNEDEIVTDADEPTRTSLPEWDCTFGRTWGLVVLIALGLIAGGGGEATAQSVRIDAGGGWGIPINDVTLEETGGGGGQLGVDLSSGPHVYAGVGIVRSISDNFALGARVRAHVSRLRSTVRCQSGACEDPTGTLRAATAEGRIIVTSPGWIQPYLLVGLGAVQTQVDPVEDPAAGRSYAEEQVSDAGGDVGLGASLPVAGGLSVDAEFRVAGALPGSLDDAVTVLPFSLGLAYEFD